MNEPLQLQPYQRRFLGMDRASQPNRACIIVSRAGGDGCSGFKGDLIIDEIYSHEIWKVICPQPAATKGGA